MLDNKLARIKPTWITVPEFYTELHVRTDVLKIVIEPSKFEDINNNETTETLLLN